MHTSNDTKIHELSLNTNSIYPFYSVCHIVVIVLLGVGKENYLMAYCFIKVTQFLVRAGISRPARRYQPLAEERAKE